MKVLIIEDESGVAQNLCDILQEIEPEIEITAIIETVKEAVAWIKNNPKPDLGFFDIRIADGESFEIFEQTTVDFPIIFTTAYDEYALKAFKVNSVDYLLKPIEKTALEAALKKYKTYFDKKTAIDQESLIRLIQEMRETKPQHYKKNLLVYVKDKILPVAVDQIAYFRLEHELVYCITHRNEKYVIDQALDKVESQLNPEHFFRANRQFLVSRKAVNSAAQHFHRKLKLEMTPSPPVDVLVSKTKAMGFKKWLEMYCWLLVAGYWLLVAG